MKGELGIRILLLNLRPRLRDIIVDALVNEPGLDLVVQELRSEQDLAHMSGDVMIVGTARPNDVEVPMRLLSMAPKMSVLMIAISGESAVMYQLKPQRKTLGELTASALIAAIRLSAGTALNLPEFGLER